MRKHIRNAEHSINQFHRDGIKEAFNWLTWDNQKINDLENFVSNAKMEREVCTTNRVSIKQQPFEVHAHVLNTCILQTIMTLLFYLYYYYIRTRFHLKYQKDQSLFLTAPMRPQTNARATNHRNAVIVLKPYNYTDLAFVIQNIACICTKLIVSRLLAICVMSI